MKSKNIIIIVAIVLVLLACSISSVLIIKSIINKKDDNNNQNTQEANTETQNNEQNPDNTSNENEENEANTEEEIVKEHNLTLTIISPEEDTFVPRQARYYNALAEGNTKYSNNVKCHWDFYLNQNNEETLYKTMDNTGILSGETKELCGFTSTFIEAQGELRVVLTVTVYNAIDDNLETVTAERKYTVL